MSLADLRLPGRAGLAGRFPESLDELRGPAAGVVVPPRHLASPGLREFDLADDRARRSLYGLLLTQGRQADLVRFVNPKLLVEDWPLLRLTLDPRVRKAVERRLRGLPAPQEPAPRDWLR